MTTSKVLVDSDLHQKYELTCVELTRIGGIEDGSHRDNNKSSGAW